MTLRAIVTEVYHSEKNPTNFPCDNPAKFLEDKLQRYARWNPLMHEYTWSSEFNQEENTDYPLRDGCADMLHRKIQGEIPSVQGMRVIVDQHRYLGGNGKLGLAVVLLEYLEGTPEEDVQAVRDHILRTGLKRG